MGLFLSLSHKTFELVKSALNRTAPAFHTPFRFCPLTLSPKQDKRIPNNFATIPKNGSFGVIWNQMLSDVSTDGISAIPIMNKAWIMKPLHQLRLGPVNFFCCVLSQNRHPNEVDRNIKVSVLL